MAFLFSCNYNIQLIIIIIIAHIPHVSTTLSIMLGAYFLPNSLHSSSKNTLLDTYSTVWLEEYVKSFTDQPQIAPARIH